MPVPESSVAIIIPAFNEEAAIEEVVRSLRDKFADAEIIVVNDGSTDSTEEKARNAGALVINHQICLGYGSALTTGVRNTTREYVLFFDGDGQHSADDAGRLIDECDGYDMVVGARTSGSHTPFLRKPGKLVLKWFSNFLAGVKIPDLNSGLRIFRRETLMRYLHLMPAGFSFSTTSTFAILKSRRRFKFVPITTRKRQGKSTVRQWRHGPKTLMLILRLTVLFSPLKAFLPISLLLFAISIGSLIVDITLGGGGVGDTTAILAVSSLIVFMFGLLCDQVSAMRREKYD
jgi:glycosyltransferase involved in cell wall biosynthesis